MSTREELRAEISDCSDRIILTALRARARQTPGRHWYQEQRAWISGMSERLPLTVRQLSGAIAALSPRTSWDYQRANTERAFGEYVSGGFEFLDHGGLGLSRDRAARILQGARPEETLGGPKVTAFYANLLGDLSTRVTVDVWAARVALGLGADETPPTLGGARYARIEQAYKQAAAELSALELADYQPAELQSLVWHARRGGIA